jgi:hypothetical protein
MDGKEAVMADCPSCAGDRYFNGNCEHCGYNWNTGRPSKQNGPTSHETLKAVNERLEAIERKLDRLSKRLIGE